MIIVVGEAPGPEKGGVTSSDRLAALVSESPEEMAEHIIWLNLWPTPASDPVRYARFIARGAEPEDLIVLLGRKVAKVFGLDDHPPLDAVVKGGGYGPTYLLLPHPSGVNRWWNDRDNFATAQETLRAKWGAHR